MKSPEVVKLGLTFDDLLLIPRLSVITTRKDVDARSPFSAGVPIAIPMVSAKMDTPSESAMAIALAREGRTGLIHRFVSIDELMADEVRQLVGGLLSGMSNCGTRTIPERQANAEFIQIASAGYKESPPRGVEKVL